MSLHSPRLLILFFSLVALGLAGCDSSSDSDDPGDGTSADAEYGINVVNTGTSDLQVSYVQSFCREGESADACLARGAGAGTAVAFPDGNVVTGLNTPDEGDVSIYVEWEVQSGQGRIEIVRATEPDSGPPVVEEVLDAFTVTTGDEGNGFFSLE